MGERFLTVREVADLFKKSQEWVYRNRFGFLRPAARSFNRRLLLFDKAEVEKIIAGSKS
jgi:predicted DNA-binding transcriptional regulator AlpA